MIGVGIGVAALLVGAGATWGVIMYRNSKKPAAMGSDRDQSFVPMVGMPVGVIGRPYSDPFFAHYGQSAVWGSGPWAHRSPRVRPVTPHFGPHRF